MSQIIVPSSGTTTPATQRTRGILLERVFNIADPLYGAKVDGVTDDINAWNLAMTAAQAAGGGVVYCPEGDSVTSSPIIIPASNISVDGADKGASRVLKLPGSNWTTFGMIAPANTWNQVGNNVRNITFDANGQNTPAMPAGVGICWAGSHSIWEHVTVVNRPGTNAATSGGVSETNYDILCLAHDVTFDHCWIHDDYSVQTLTSSPIGAASYPSTTSIVLASATGVQIGGHLILDPNVSAFTSNVVAGAGSATITPAVTHANPFPNGGMTTAMRGIYVGQSLVIDTVASGVQETVTVSAVTNSTFTAPFANAHAAGVPIVYNGTTETVQISNLVSTTVTATTLLAHPSNPNSTGAIAVLTIPMTSDGIGIGHAHVTANTQATMTETIAIHHCRFERLGLDGAGWATTKHIAFDHNVVRDCIVGVIAQDSIAQHIDNNTFDFTNLGIMPNITTAGGGGVITPAAGPNYAGVCVFNEAPEFSTLLTGLEITNNHVFGGTFGVYRGDIANAGILMDGMVIGGNVLINQGLNAMLLNGVDTGNVHHNIIRNPNRREWATDPTVGSGNVAAILLMAANASQAINVLRIDNNIITADAGVYSDNVSHMQAAIIGAGTSLHWGTVVASNNTLIGYNPTGIAFAAGFPIYCTNNGPAFQPRAGAITGLTLGSSPAAVTNNSGFDVQYNLTVGGVSFTALNVTNTAGGSPVNMAATGILKHGCTLNVAWSAGTPVLTSYYL